MLVDIKYYYQDIEVFGRKEMDYDTSLGWLLEKQEKGKDIDEIDVQVYTLEEMPVDSLITADWTEAGQFIKDVAKNALEGKYRGIYATNSTEITQRNSQRQLL